MLGRAERYAEAEGLSWSKSKDARISSVTHPVFLLLLLIAQLQMSLGNTSLTGNEVTASQGQLSHGGGEREDK